MRPSPASGNVRLVWCEYHGTIGGAIPRGRNMKSEPGRCGFILAMNPDYWDDLYAIIDQ